MASTAIIGAGLAGLTCTERLATHGVEVTLFDKGRGPGGRTSTRRREIVADGSRHTLRFDHGAQYFTARDPVFVTQTERWLADGVVAPWSARIVSLTAGRPKPVGADVTRYVGLPGMSALTRHLGRHLDVRYGVRVTQLGRTADGWRLTAENSDELGTYDGVVVAVPAPQAVPLLTDAPDLQARVAAVDMVPCLAAMVAFASPLDLPFDGAFVDDAPVDWVARNSSKPGRAALPECWVLHATTDWSRARFDQDPDRWSQDLIAAFGVAAGIELPAPLAAAGHRWGFARTENAPDVPCLASPDDGIAVCGDWCPGARVEGAYLSGRAAAERLLAPTGPASARA